MLSMLCVKVLQIFSMHWISVSADTDQEVNTRQEAEEGQRKRMENLKTIFMATLWKDILEGANKTSKVLQSKDVDMLVAMYLLESLRGILRKLWTNLVNMI